jgi:hypothetical protein
MDNEAPWCQFLTSQLKREQGVIVSTTMGGKASKMRLE